jgi:hypothetical protein
MGFDPAKTWYHGTATDKPIAQFKSGKKGDSPHLDHETPAIFFSDKPELASEYAFSTAEQRRQRMADDLFKAGKHDEAQSLFHSMDTGEANAASKAMKQEALSMLPDNLPRILEPAVMNGTRLDQKALAETLGPDGLRRFNDLLEMSQNIGTGQPNGAAIYPTHLPKNMMEVDGGFFGGQFNEIAYNQLLKRAREQGYPGLVVKNVVDSPSGMGEPANIAAIFDPARIRSVNAAFDPAKASSPNIMASHAAPAIGAAGAGALGAFTRRDEEAY